MTFSLENREFVRFYSSPLFLGLMACIWIIFHANLVLGTEVTLQWDPNTEADLAGYRLYYGFSSRSYDNVVDLGDQTTYTLSGLEQGQTYYFALTAFDTEGLESGYSNEVTRSFLTTNQAPTADAGPDQKVDEGIFVTLSGLNSTDPDDGIASYLWEQIGGLPVELSSESSAETRFLAPDIGAEGETLHFRLIVADNGGLQSSDDCLVNISWVNESPSADAGPDQEVNEGDTVTLDAVASTDPDDGIASYLWKQTTGFAVSLSDNTAVQPTFRAPDVGQEGDSFSFLLTVTDNGGLKATDTCIVNVVGWDNLPPSAEAGPDQTAIEGQTVLLDGSDSYDPDDGIASYRWAQKTGTPVILDNPAEIRPSFTAPDIASVQDNLAFELTVTDEGGLQSSDKTTIIVGQANAGPDLTGSWARLERTDKRRGSVIRASTRIDNIGTQQARSSWVYFYLSRDAALDSTDVRVGKKTVDQLEAGQSFYTNLRISIRRNQSYTYLIARIDPANTISETDESNNIIVSWPF